MKFTIIIPAYNSSEFINIPLESLERQSFKDFEVLIIDDGSKDNLNKTVAPFLKRNTNWKIIKKENGNWGSVINYTRFHNYCKGEYISVLDSDDLLMPNCLNEVSKHNHDVIITNILIREAGEDKKQKVYFGKSREIKKKNAFTPLSTPHGKFYKKELWDQMIFLREKVSYQDTVLFNDLLSKANDIYYISDPLAIWWRDRPGNSTTISWNEERANLWISTCRRIVTLPDSHPETNSWALMYLWELGRHYKGETIEKVPVQVKKAKFKWVPFGLRNISKIYFLLKTKKYRGDDE